MSPADPTVAFVLRAWLTHLNRTRQVAPVTLARYRQVCGTLSETTIWSRRLNTLRPDEIEAAIMATGGSDETRRLRWRVLRAGLNWGSREYGLQNVTAAVSIAPTAPRQRPTLNGSAQERILAAVSGDPVLDPFVLLACITGARRNEVLALRVRDVVDVDAGLLAFRGSLVRDHRGRWHVRPATSGTTYVQIPGEHIDRLRALLAQRSGSDAFLCSRDGGCGHLDPGTIWRAFRTTADALGFYGFRLDDLRRTCDVVVIEHRTAPGL